jgi:hypothetical protein
MGRTMARSGTGAPLMKMMGVLPDWVWEEEEVLAGGGLAVELGRTLVPVPEDEPDPDPDPEPDPELGDDGAGTNLEELGKPGEPGPGVGCEGPEGRLEDGEDGEAPDFPPPSWRSRTSSRARRDERMGGSILEMRLAIRSRLDTHSLAQTSTRVRGERPTMFTSSTVGPAVKTEKGKKRPVGGGDREVIKLVVAALHPTPESVLRRASRDENRLLGLH